MSHFLVLVIGPDVEAQLQPYHEFECTGVEDQYVIDVDVTEQAHTSHAEYGKDQPFREWATEWYGIEPNDKYTRWDGDRIISRTNPNKKWDWYQIGGRWTGFFKLKEGAQGAVGDPGLMTDAAAKGTADQLTKGDIDIDGMRAEAMSTAAERIDKVLAAIDGLPIPQPFESFEGEIDDRRDAYHAQPAIQALKDIDALPFMGDPIEDYCLKQDEPREAYIRDAANSALVPYAIVMEGQWMGRGEMGWFGMSSDDMDRADWCARINEVIDRVPDDTPFTIVDCHI